MSNTNWYALPFYFLVVLALLVPNVALAQPDYNLTVAVTPVDTGNVSINGTLPASYPNTTTWANGSVVPITATPDAYWNFDSWTGDVSDIGDVNATNTTINMTGDYSITANFVQVSYKLTIAVIGSGTTTPSGVHSYPNGTNVTITATPATYWNFVNWTTTGNISEIDDPDSPSTTVTVDANKTVIANFAQVNKTLTMAVSGGGTTTPAIGPHSYVNGTVVNITAIPNAHRGFVNWTTTGDISEIDDPDSDSTTVVVDENKTVTANFAVAYNLTVTVTPAGQGNKVKVNGVAPASYPKVYPFVTGTDVTLEAVAASGYVFDEWSGGVTGSTNPTHIIINANKTVTAKFAVAYNLTVDVTPDGKGKVKVNGTASTSYPKNYTFAKGTNVTLKAEAVTGYKFNKWSGSITVTTNPTYIIISANKTVTANFVKTSDDDGDGGGSSKPDAKFTANKTSGAAPLTVKFTDTSTSTPTSWSWNFGDGTTKSTNQNPTHKYTAVGKYNVSLTATNSKGSDTETKTNYITVTAAIKPDAQFTANKTSGAAPLTVKFTDSSTNTPTSWSWDFGDGGTSTDKNPTHKYTAVGIYTVALTATNSKGSDTETKSSYITVTSGGGTGQYSVSLNILGKTSTGQINSTGKLLRVINVTSTNGAVSIRIANGTFCLGNDGGRLGTISVNNVGNGTNLSAPENQHIIAAYKLTPSGATFTPGLDLTLSYEEDELPEGVSEKGLYIAYYDDTGGKWNTLQSQVNTGENTATAKVKHFTTFALIGKATSWLGKYWWIIAVGVVVTVLLLFFLWWRRREAYYY